MLIQNDEMEFEKTSRLMLEFVIFMFTQFYDVFLMVNCYLSIWFLFKSDSDLNHVK